MTFLPQSTIRYNICVGVCMTRRHLYRNVPTSWCMYSSLRVVMTFCVDIRESYWHFILVCNITVRMLCRYLCRYPHDTLTHVSQSACRTDTCVTVFMSSKCRSPQVVLAFASQSTCHTDICVAVHKSRWHLCRSPYATMSLKLLSARRAYTWVAICFSVHAPHEHLCIIPHVALTFVLVPAFLNDTVYVRVS